MHISINTAEEISDLDRQVLAVLSGYEFVLGGPGQTFEDDESVEPDVEAEEEPEPEPKPRRTRRKPAPEPEPEPEEEPEPMAEEPVEEDEDEGEVDMEEESDEDLLALAIKKAQEMVQGGDAGKVREALDAAGASRVRELNADNVREFFKALG